MVPLRWMCPAGHARSWNPWAFEAPDAHRDEALALHEVTLQPVKSRTSERAFSFMDSFRGNVQEGKRPMKVNSGKGHPFPEITRGFWCLVSAMDLLVDFSWTFPAHFPWKKKQNPPKNPRSSRELFDQNPRREISALINGPSRTPRGNGPLRPRFWLAF